MLTNMNIRIEGGLPPHKFFGPAWASEPLTKELDGTNILFALPLPDNDISLKSVNEDGEVVGQCSANRAIKYWKHLDGIDASEQNSSTQIFIKIHKKAVLVEKKYLEQIDELEENAFHSAGIAVLPNYRGQELGLSMRKVQIDLCRTHNATTLFCETTNKFSAKTVAQCGFSKIAEYSYSDLAREFNADCLKKLDDFFTIWCLKV